MASSKVSSLTASDALAGTELFYADGLASAVAADVKVTSTQIKTWTSASPTLVTPVLGVATGTSIALGGATLGTNALAITGQQTITGNLRVGGAGVTFGASTLLADFVTANGTAAVLEIGQNGQVGWRLGIAASTAGLRFNDGDDVLSASSIELRGAANFTPSGVVVRSSGAFGWSNTTNASGTLDTTISRNAAGVIQFGTTAANAAGSLLATNGTFIGGTLIADNGAAAVSPFIVKDNGSAVFTIADGGNVAATGSLTAQGLTSNSSISATTSISLGAGNGIGWSTRSFMFSLSDSTILLTNQAINNFDRLQFGGTTSSFPAIKRSTTILQARLADDSAYAPFEANTVRTATAYTVATLPAAGTAGRMAYVTDALAPSFLTTVVGGGAVVAPVFDNGTNWVGA